MPAVALVPDRRARAIAAQGKNSVKYDFKPFPDESVNEVPDADASQRSAEQAARLTKGFALLQALATRHSHRVGIRAKGRILFIDPSDVVAVEAQGHYVVLQCDSASYLLRESISVIAEKLKPYGFIRIHRSILVNSAFVEEICPWQTGEYGLRIKSGKVYTVTRTYKKNLSLLAEFWIGTDALFSDSGNG
jgi:DNA-binding LytR/AlgR family response regulator